MKHFLGIDIGGTNIKYGVVTEKGELLEKHKIATDTFATSSDFPNLLAKEINDILSKYPNVQDVGIGVPGLLSKDRKSTIELPNLVALSHVPLLSLLQKASPSIHFHLENDANAAALGEYYFGEKPQLSSFLFITMGTGVGGGAIIDGKLFKGANGNALEPGHIIIDGKHTVEEKIGKAGLVRRALDLLSSGQFAKTTLDSDNLTAKALVNAALTADPLGTKVFHDAGKILGTAIVNMVRVLDVTNIIIGGGVAKTYHLIEQPMWETIHYYLPAYYTSKMKIKQASLKNSSGILGAASLCFLHDNER